MSPRRTRAPARGAPPAAIDRLGGVVLLDDDCTPGDVTLTFEDETVVTVPGPVCSPDSIEIASSSHVTVVPGEA